MGKKVLQRMNFSTNFMTWNVTLMYDEQVPILQLGPAIKG